MTPPRHATVPGPPIPAAIDLHSHSTASDGLLSPAEVVVRAVARGIRILALTDHDTTAGLTAARQEADGRIELVAGVELSCVPDGLPELLGDIHIVALRIDPDSPALQNELAAQSDDRHQRAARMVARLQELGYPVTLDEVRRHAGGGNPGRPHVARALVDAGVVAAVGDAFSPELIGDGGRGYIARQAVRPEQAITLARQAGGVAVLAHPGVYGLTPARLDGFVARLAAVGLAGIEVDHPDHPSEVRDGLRGLARRHKLVPVGASDCHGYEPLALGSESTSPDAWDELQHRASLA